MIRFLRKVHILPALAACLPIPPALAAAPLPDADAVRAKMEAVAAWQEANPSKHPVLDWTRAPYYLGLLAASSSTGNETWADAVRKIGREQSWHLGKRPFMGDDHAVGQAWLDLYQIDRLPEQLAAAEAGMKAFGDRPLGPSLEWKGGISSREWAWCDSLFMSPQLFAQLTTITGDRSWLVKMDKRYWQTYAYLFDPKENLFFRDSSFFPKREPNGTKVFWSRGNGWVFAGLVHILENMPADHPTRPKYVDLFRKMAKRLVALQQPDGAWHASLLDPASFPVPESSGTAFYCYGLLWGTNQGLLDPKDCLPAALKAWQRLDSHVHENGMLGFVQPIGDSPKSVTADMTDVYGPGGFLLAGSELRNLILLDGARRAKFSVQNPSNLNRFNEVTSLPRATVTKLLPKPNAGHLTVRDAQTGQFVPTQILDGKGDGTPDGLLFLASALPGQTRSYEIIETKSTPVPARPSRLYARYVPERKDDFAFENDRLAFRFFGPKMAAENGHGGLDVWMKRTRDPVIDRWYKSEHYDVDGGEGCACYHSGASLGCGALGYLTRSGEIVPSPVFAKWKLIAKGPLRMEFELGYDPVKAGGAEITETRHVSLDLGSNFARITSRFQTSGKLDGIRPVAGLRHENGEPTWQQPNMAANWGATDGQGNGQAGTGLVAKGTAKAGSGHIYIPLADDLSKPVTWLAGAGFSNGPDYPTFESWQKAVQTAAQTLREPLLITTTKH